ncbi:MAG: hypothetical protein IKE15_09990 [Clostridia bacterium]|nr:hypothetical protein [Clostridia bacterium]
MKQKRLLWIPLLLLVLAVSFLVHAETYSLPLIPEEDRAYYLDETGEPYLTEIDSYFFVRLAREMSENGPFLYNKRFEDPLMATRPVKSDEQTLPTLPSLLAYFVWRILSLFGKTDVISVARWMGPVLASLAAVPAFFYLKRRTNLAGAFAGAMLTGVSIPFVAHTHAGFFDTDMLLGVLPLGFVLLQLYATQAARLRSQVIAGICSGFLLGLVSMTWYAHFAYFWLMVLGGLLGLILIMLCPMHIPFRRRMQAARGIAISVLSALAMVFLFRGTPGLNELGSILTAFRNVSGSSSSFPFIHQYTGEMQSLAVLPVDKSVLSLLKGEISTELGCVGGILPCIFIILAFPMGIRRSLRKKELPEAPQRHDAMIALLAEIGMLVLWLAAGAKLTMSRRRFAEIIVLPGAVIAGLGVGFVTGLLKNRRFPWKAAVGAVLSAAVCLPMVFGARALARAEMPSVSDSMDNAMRYVEEHTPEDTAVAAWWDYGYFIEYTARRRAIVDGGSTSAVINYFMAHALLTDSPAQMAGLLRMTEVSGSSALYTLTGAGLTQPVAADALLRMAETDRNGAEEILRELSVPEADRAAVLNLTHPEEEKPLLLVLTGDLMAKLEALSYFGMWDLETRTVTDSVYWTHGDAARELGPGGEASWYMQLPEIVLNAKMDGTGAVEAEMSKNGVSYQLSRLCVWQDGVKVQDTALPGNGPAVILIRENGAYTAVSCSPNLCDSMLFRLYICQDQTIKGAKHLGTWYGKPTGDPSPAQQRVIMGGLAIWPAQVWEISESPETWTDGNGGSES